MRNPDTRSVTTKSESSRTMLPDYQYRHYYDEMCGECEDEMVSQDEVTEEGGRCGECEMVMCEGCREGRSCNWCQETFEEEDFDNAKVSVAVCETCAVRCEHCPDLLFHPSCLVNHRCGCTHVSRAQRALSEIEEEIEEKEYLVSVMNRRLAVLQKEKAKVEVEVQKLKRRKKYA